MFNAGVISVRIASWKWLGAAAILLIEQWRANFLQIRQIPKIIQNWRDIWENFTLPTKVQTTAPVDLLFFIATNYKNRFLFCFSDVLAPNKLYIFMTPKTPTNEISTVHHAIKIRDILKGAETER